MEARSEVATAGPVCACAYVVRCGVVCVVGGWCIIALEPDEKNTIANGGHTPRPSMCQKRSFYSLLHTPPTLHTEHHRELAFSSFLEETSAEWCEPLIVPLTADRKCEVGKVTIDGGGRHAIVFNWAHDSMGDRSFASRSSSLPPPVDTRWNPRAYRRLPISLLVFFL